MKSLTQIFSDDNVLVITLQERMDSAVCLSLKEEILDIATKMPDLTFVVDASKLTYISSQGLRLLLMLAKIKKDRLIIREVSDYIYNELDITGFTDIIDVERALPFLDLSTCEKISEGAFSVVYRKSEEEIVKIDLKDENVAALQHEMKRSRQAFVLGVPTPISFNVVKCSDGHLGLVYEIIEGETLAHTLRNNPQNLRAYVESYTRLMKNLHATEASEKVFGTFKGTVSQRLREVPFFTDDEREKLLTLVDAIPDAHTLVHADPHLKNIMVQDGELMFIDMGDITTGHPFCDFFTLAMLYILQLGLAEQVTLMKKDLRRRFWYSYLKEYLGLEGEEATHFSKLCAAMGALMIVSGLNGFYRTLMHRAPFYLKVMREKLIPYYDEMLDDLHHLDRWMPATP